MIQRGTLAIVRMPYDHDDNKVRPREIHETGNRHGISPNENKISDGY